MEPSAIQNNKKMTMILLETEKLIIEQRYGLSIEPFEKLSQNEQQRILMGDYGVRVCLTDAWHDVIPPYMAARANHATEDGKYHLIYIQVNMTTGEYYVGKVNRAKWKEVKRYQGSGLLFIKKYKKHSEEFIRYYIVSCKTEKESEEMEASIVNEELLSDPFCLNLVKGGGGVTGHSTEERNQKIREYMISHPERYQNMLQKAKELYLSGDSEALRNRSDSIRKTMSNEKYRKMTKERIAKWKDRNPEGYAEARRRNKEALQTDEYRKKRKESHDKWRDEHPEEYRANMEKAHQAAHSEVARKKRSSALKKWCEEHPDIVRQRQRKSAEKAMKSVNMISLDTGEVLQTFESQQEAALWLVEQGIAKNTNCKSSISAVCLKRPCTTGYGYRKKAYGFGWEFAE